MEGERTELNGNVSIATKWEYGRMKWAGVKWSSVKQREWNRKKGCSGGALTEVEVGEWNKVDPG